MGSDEQFAVDLAAASLTMAAAGDPQATAEQVVACAVAVVGSDSAALGLMQYAVPREAKALPVPLRAGTDHALLGTMVDLARQAGDSPSWEAARAGTTVHCPDLRSESRWPRWGRALSRRRRCGPSSRVRSAWTRVGGVY